MFGALGGLLSQDGASRLLRLPRFPQVVDQNPRSVSTIAKRTSSEPHWTQNLHMDYFVRFPNPLINIFLPSCAADTLTLAMSSGILLTMWYRSGIV